VSPLNKYAAKRRLIEKLAFETQDYELRDGKIYSVFGSNRLKTMTMSQGLKPKRETPGENYWTARKEVTDPDEKKRALATLLKRNRGRFGGKPFFGKKRKRYSKLEAIKEKRASKHPPPTGKKEFIQGGKSTPPKSKKPFLNKLTSGKFSILPGLSNTRQKRGGSKPALGARLQWRF